MAKKNGWVDYKNLKSGLPWMINIHPSHQIRGLSWLYCEGCQHSINEPLQRKDDRYLHHALESECRILKVPVIPVDYVFLDDYKKIG